MDDILVRASDIPWEDASGHAPGMHRKVLLRGADGAPRVALLKLDAGFAMDAHSHAAVENHYVLEGMYEAGGREFTVGTYHRIPKHQTHGPFRSGGGALVLVFWEP